MQLKNIDKLVSYGSKHKSGFTVELKRGHLRRLRGTEKKRFVVASETLIELNEQRMIIFVNAMNRGTFGGWYNELTKTYLIEHVNIYHGNDLIRAVRAAQATGQIAIYDLIEDKELKIRRTNT